MNKKTLFLTLLIALAIFPIFASAEISIIGMVDNVLKVIWYIAVAIVVAFWLITGVLFVTAVGDPGKVGTAKKALFASVAGTILVILAYSAMNIISNALFSGQ